MDFSELGMKIISKLFGDTTKTTSSATVVFEPTIILPAPVVEPPSVMRTARVPPSHCLTIDVVPDDCGEPVPIEARNWTAEFVAQANAEQKLVGDECASGSWEELDKNP